MKSLMTVCAGIALMFGFLGISQAVEKHLFYIHGCCIDKVGGGAYETIVKDLQSAGFNVVFDLRYDDSTPAVQAYATKVADQVKSLLAKGTAPEDITVSGYSLGSRAAMFASIEIANPKVNYVLLAGCPRTVARSFYIDYAKVQGRILSLVDTTDNIFESCKAHLPESALKKEVEFDSGYGHAIFRFTTEKAYKLWKEPLEAWAKGQ
ncbi:MAG: hypothetical protein AABY73_05140 [Pseudomonadota bacterium]